jgi:hypothetical protein
MSSHQGLTRIGQNGGVIVLTLIPSATAVAAPFAGYGTIGLNDTGPVLFEGIGFIRGKFQLLGAGAIAAGYTVGVYTTISPAILNAIGQSNGTGTYLDWRTAHGDTAIIPASDWVLLDSVSSNASTGPISNPMVSGTTWSCDTSAGPFVAYRFVLTAVTGGATANAQVAAFLTP